MNLILMSKNRGRRQKMPKTKIVRKTRICVFRRPRFSARSPKKGSFRYILIAFHLLMQKDLKDLK